MAVRVVISGDWCGNLVAADVVICGSRYGNRKGDDAVRHNQHNHSGNNYHRVA